MLFDSRPTVAWPPTTVAWPFSDFFRKISDLLETSKECCLTVGRRSRDRSATFFKISTIWFETSKNLVWLSANGRVTSVDCHVTVQRQFLKFCISAETSKYSSLTVSRRSRDLRRLSRDRSATIFKILHFSWNVEIQFFDSQPTVAWPPSTVTWPFSDNFQNFAISAETSKYSSLTVSRRSRDLRRLSRDRSATFFKKFPICLKRLKNIVWQSADGRVTSDDCRVTVQRLFSKNFRFAWNV